MDRGWAPGHPHGKHQIAQASQPASSELQPRPSWHVVVIGHSATSAHEDAPVHDTSHEHDSEHLTPRRHEPVPLQVTLQGPLPHRISSPQLDAPVHWTSHDVAAPQTMWCEHARSPHTTRHGTFGGHCTSDTSQLPVTLQSITQTPASSHVPFVHPSLHSATSESVGEPSVDPGSPPSEASGSSHCPCPGMTHQPSLQCWPPVQSVANEHCTVQSRTLGW